MSQQLDSLEHEARKDRTTYAAAVLLAGVAGISTDLQNSKTYEEMLDFAAELAVKLERKVSAKLDEEFKRGK